MLMCLHLVFLYMLMCLHQGFLYKAKGAPRPYTAHLQDEKFFAPSAHVICRLAHCPPQNPNVLSNSQKIGTVGIEEKMINAKHQQLQKKGRQWRESICTTKSHWQKRNENKVHCKNVHLVGTKVIRKN